MNTIQYYLIDTIIQSPEYHLNRAHDSNGKAYDYLGQIEAEEEHERLCRLHSKQNQFSSNSHEVNETTPILPCTCQSNVSPTISASSCSSETLLPDTTL